MINRKIDGFVDVGILPNHLNIVIDWFIDFRHIISPGLLNYLI